MADSPRLRYSRSPSPPRARARARSRSQPRSRSRSKSKAMSLSPRRHRSCTRSRSRSRFDVVNPGNTLFVSGLSSRVSQRILEDHFSKEGKVSSAFIVMEPHTQISRGFAFVTMDTVEGAERCIKHLNQSVLEGRYITVEKSRRKRARTPTPGHYLGINKSRDAGYRVRHRGGYSHDNYNYRRSPRRSPYRGRGYSPRRSPYTDRSRRYRSRSYSPYGSPDRGYGPRSGIYAR